jgi:hypothetical protein
VQLDGLGNALTDFDDPNLPSLLAMPLLGFEYDAEVRRLLQPSRWQSKHCCLALSSQHYNWMLEQAVGVVGLRKVFRRQAPAAAGHNTHTHTQCQMSCKTCGGRLQVYAATRSRILSSANAYYFQGSSFTGLGSPHTPNRYIWPLAHMVEALTTEPTTQGA